MTEIKPFERLQIAHTKADIGDVAHLLDDDASKNLICDVCGEPFSK